jgi:hypothetical protein
MISIFYIMCQICFVVHERVGSRARARVCVCVCVCVGAWVRAARGGEELKARQFLTLLSFVLQAELNYYKNDKINCVI